MANIYDYVKGKVNIVDVIEKFSNISLTHTGNGKYVGHHTAHDSDSKTSLHVDELEGVFYCHNCKQGGSCLDYVVSLNSDSMDIYEAVVAVAEAFNIDIYQNYTEDQKKGHKSRQAKIRSVEKCFIDAINFYHDQLGEKRSYFHNRGINDETIDKLKLGYASDSWTNLKDHLQSKGHSEESMLATGMIYKHKTSDRFLPYFFDRYIFPYWKNSRPCYASGRDATKDGKYITPDGRSIEVAKYIKLKFNDNVDRDVIHHQLWGINRLRVPKRILKKRINVKSVNRAGKDGSEQSLIHESIEADAPPKIVITEGIIDSVLSFQELSDYGWITISPTTTELSEEDLHDVVDILEFFPKCEVVFCFDMDDAGYRGAWKSAKHCDDAIFYRLAVNYFHNVLEKIIDPANIEEHLKVVYANKTLYKEMMEYITERKPTIKMSLIPKPDDVDKIDLSDMYLMKKTEEVIYWIEAAKSVKEYELKLKNNPLRFFKDMKKFEPKRMSDELCTDGRFFHCVEDTIYEYNKGVYDKCKVPLRRDVNIKLKHFRKSTTNSEVLKDIVNTYGLEDGDLFMQNDIINFKNGLVPVTTESQSFIESIPTSKPLKDEKIFTHTPHIPMLSQIPINFNHKANCPKINEFISQVVIQDDIPIMYEMIGYCLHASTDMESAFILIGEGSNGKSTFLKIIERLLGKKNVSHISMQDLDESRFKYAEVFGKLANIYADIPNSPLAKVDRFNSIVTGDTIQAERKGEHPFDFTPYSTLIFSCNTIPRSHTKTKGYYRRIIPIRFPYNFGAGNKDDEKEKEHQTKLIDKVAIEEELEGLANMSLKFYADAHKKGTFTISNSSLVEMDEYRKMNEPELEFLNDDMVVITSMTLEIDGQLIRVGRTKLYETYKEWLGVLSPRLKPVSANEFYKKVKLELPYVEEYNTRINGKQVKAFKGIGLIENDIEDPSDDDIPL